MEYENYLIAGNELYCITSKDAMSCFLFLNTHPMVMENMLHGHQAEKTKKEIAETTKTGINTDQRIM